MPVISQQEASEANLVEREKDANLSAIHTNASPMINQGSALASLTNYFSTPKHLSAVIRKEEERGKETANEWIAYLKWRQKILMMNYCLLQKRKCLKYLKRRGWKDGYYQTQDCTFS